MVNTALQNAEALREKLAAEINALQRDLELKRKELERVKVFIADYAAFSQGFTPVPLSGSADLFPPNPFQQPTPLQNLVPFTVPEVPEDKHVNPDKSLVGDAVQTILYQNQRPMGRDDLFHRVKDDFGLDIRGKDPRMVFTTMLWRMPERFVRITGKGYWLKNEPCPAVNYWPPPPN